MGASRLRRRQRRAAAGAGRRVVMKDFFDRQLLHTPVSRGAGALSGTPSLRRLLGRTWFAPALLRWVLRFFVPGRRRLICTLGWLGFSGRITTILAFPRRAAARGTGTVVRMKIVFVLISRGDYYRDATVDYEAMSVERNAPRWIRMLKQYGYLGAASGAGPASGAQPAVL
jgi:hypothetical protein